MAMSRKHYERVAAILAGEMALTRDVPTSREIVRRTALSLADVFAQDNPRFDRTRFYTASGVTEDDAPIGNASVAWSAEDGWHNGARVTVAGVGGKLVTEQGSRTGDDA